MTCKIDRLIGVLAGFTVGTGLLVLGHDLACGFLIRNCRCGLFDNNFDLCGVCRKTRDDMARSVFSGSVLGLGIGILWISAVNISYV